MSIMSLSIIDIYFFFFNDTATTEIYTLSLHDALPITVNLYGVNINFLISARVGGHVTSATQAMMDSYGVSKVTADARDAGGVTIDGHTYDAKRYYTTIGQNRLGAYYLYAATNIKLDR